MWISGKRMTSFYFSFCFLIVVVSRQRLTKFIFSFQCRFVDYVGIGFVRMKMNYVLHVVRHIRKILPNSNHYPKSRCVYKQQVQLLPIRLTKFSIYLFADDRSENGKTPARSEAETENYGKPQAFG